jgi:HAE1 family hydrophobic/amphiphilic exporter-1
MTRAFLLALVVLGSAFRPGVASAQQQAPDAALAPLQSPSSSPPASTAQAGAALSRLDAVKAALSVNPDAVKAREDLRSLEGRITEVRADALPDISVRATGTRYRDPTFLNSSSFDNFPPDLIESLKPIPANLFDVGTEVKQTLYSFKLGRALKVAKIARQLGEEDAHRVRQAVALDAARAYNTLLLTLEYVRVNQTSLSQKEEHLKSVRNRRQAGVATDLDVLRSEVDVENQRAQFVRAQGRVDLARATLNAAMVRPIDAPIEPTDTLETAPLAESLDQALTAAIGTRPEIKSAKLSEQARTEAIGVEQAELKPHFDFNGAFGYSVRQPKNLFHYDYSKWSFGVTATIPVFDGGRAAGRVAQARAEQAKAVQDIVAAQNQVRLQTKDAYDRMHVAARLLSAADLNIGQAKRALDMTQANYSLGAATLLDVTDAQAALNEAERVRVDALHEQADSRATLRYAMGLDPVEGLAGGHP